MVLFPEIPNTCTLSLKLALTLVKLVLSHLSLAIFELMPILWSLEPVMLLVWELVCEFFKKNALVSNISDFLESNCHLFLQINVIGTHLLGTDGLGSLM